MENKIEIRCIRCNKLLCRVPVGTVVDVEIKCTKCKTVHTYKLDKEG